MSDEGIPEKAVRVAFIPFIQRGGQVVSIPGCELGNLERQVRDPAEAGELRELAKSLGFDVTRDARYWLARPSFERVEGGRALERCILWHDRVQKGNDGLTIEEGRYYGGDIEDDAMH